MAGQYKICKGIAFS